MRGKRRRKFTIAGTIMMIAGIIALVLAVCHLIGTGTGIIGVLASGFIVLLSMRLLNESDAWWWG